MHPIEGLMRAAMESIREMIDVNTVVGDPVEAQDGTLIIPVSRVSFGFAAGGGEYDAAHAKEDNLPFGGGSGAGVSVSPVAFLVCSGQQVRLLAVDGGAAVVDRLIDVAPRLIDQVNSVVRGRESSPQPRVTAYNPT